MLFSLCALTNLSYSQCCSMGSPAGASTYVGVLAKNHLRFIVFYRNNYLDTYFEGYEPSKINSNLKKSFYNYTGITLSYGITKRLTIDADAGYFINKTQILNIGDETYRVRGYGFSNGSLMVKYAAYMNAAKGIELTVGAGGKFPFSGKPLYVDGARLVIDLQPSSNAFGLSGQLIFSKDFRNIGMRLMSLNKYEYNFRNPDHYMFGSSFSNSVFVSKKIVNNLFAVLQVRNEYRLRDIASGSHEGNTGGEVMIASAQVSYSLFGKWHIAGLFDFPFYKNYNGRQLSPKYSFAFSLTRDLNLNKKTCNPTDKTSK
jgi:hypothetical protein